MAHCKLVNRRSPMRRKTILALGLTLLAMLMLVAAGCGGGGSKNTAATTEAATTEATTTEAATTEAATTEAATTTATTTPDLSGIASAGNCKELADLRSKLSTAFSGSATPDDIKKEAAVLNEIADKAPSEIKADFKTMAAFVAKVADSYEQPHARPGAGCGDAAEASGPADGRRQGDRRGAAHLRLGRQELPRLTADRRGTVPRGRPRSACAAASRSGPRSGPGSRSRARAARAVRRRRPRR